MTRASRADHPIATVQFIVHLPDEMADTVIAAAPQSRGTRMSPAELMPYAAVSPDARDELEGSRPLRAAPAILRLRWETSIQAVTITALITSPAISSLPPRR